MSNILEQIAESRRRYPRRCSVTKLRHHFPGSLATHSRRLPNPAIVGVQLLLVVSLQNRHKIQQLARTTSSPTQLLSVRSRTDHITLLRCAHLRPWVLLVDHPTTPPIRPTMGTSPSTTNHCALQPVVRLPDSPLSLHCIQKTIVYFDILTQ